jgi:hypothetical protein
LDEFRAQLEQLPFKSLEHLAQEMKVPIPRGTSRTITKLLKLQPYRAAVVLLQQPCGSVAPDMVFFVIGGI